MESQLDNDTAILLLAYIAKYVDVRLPEDFLSHPAPDNVVFTQENGEYVMRVEN